ncbi:DUF1036 domain-containing protein [Calycomorphotria hydatis]|uniref:DUF1036 domain-containing protein n=1 Tax=Calycomorphotria hydatis TaxID=2528027 RepID=A0A517TF92_9PLAN|nr:DUF1036 domain-containing protein [Calycomorphotria hydatis]QDT67028.1 hypothetical protein V22_43000 [Calycomorphotria hydatis]
MTLRCLSTSLLFTLLLTATAVAQEMTPYSFKNQTSTSVWVAVGFNENGNFVSSGWFEVKPNATLTGFGTYDGVVYYSAFAWDGQKRTAKWGGNDKRVFVEDPSEGFRLVESETRTGGKIKKVGMKKVKITQSGQSIVLR